MPATLAMSQFDAALRALDDDDASPADKAEMLMEIALGLQQRPQSVEPLQGAIELYRRALELCPPDALLLRARVGARLGTAWQALPDGGADALLKAQACHEEALALLAQHGGSAEEAAEVELNLGLVRQSLAGAGQARLADAVACYHRALRVFTRDAHPREFAILHNNLAIAYLSIPLADARANLREALAVQSFEEVLKVVDLIDHPSEYAMAQNNLGNALQYAASGHPLENNLRALAAYDEALKVRNERDTPLEYANTLANKANVLRNLPPADGEFDAQANLRCARELYSQAQAVFVRMQQARSAAIVGAALAEIERQLAPRPGNGGA